MFIDEADKCLDFNAEMVSKAEATQLQHAIVTHSTRKPIYWVLLGTFTAMRGTQSISYEMLEKTLGRELASRVDYIDFEFSSWTLETLLQAVNSICAKRGLKYQDEALLEICRYCIQSGGAVRAFDNIDQALARKLSSLKKDNGFPEVTLEMAKELLSRMGYKNAA